MQGCKCCGVACKLTYSTAACCLQFHSAEACRVSTLLTCSSQIAGVAWACKTTARVALSPSFSLSLSRCPSKGSPFQLGSCLVIFMFVLFQILSPSLFVSSQQLTFSAWKLSRPVVGSSKKMRRGCPMSSHAMARRFFSPPDRPLQAKRVCEPACLPVPCMWRVA